MSDDPRDTSRPKDFRRTTGGREPARPPSGSMQRVVEVHVPTQIQSRTDDDAFRRRIISEVDERLRGMAEGMARHVREVVHMELLPYVDKLARIDQVVEMLEADREERREYRAKQEARAELEQQQRATDMHRLAIQRGHVEIQTMNVDAQLKPIEASRKYKLALVGVLVAVITALAGLVGAAVASHR